MMTSQSVLTIEQQALEVTVLISAPLLLTALAVGSPKRHPVAPMVATFEELGVKGVDVDLRPDGLAIELRVVVEHGLKLAEVAETVGSRVRYELERMVGLPIASLEVHIEGVRSH